MYLWLLELFFAKKCKEQKIDVDNLLHKAIELQYKNSYKEAKKIYLYIISLKCQIELFDYSVALNNLVVILYNTKEFEDAKRYYKELSRVREKLLYADIELYGIDYIYTKIMGIEWFNSSNKELNSLQEMLQCYKGVYNTFYLEEKIKTLQ